MRETRKRADWPIIAGVIIALMAVALGVYVGGYFCTGKALDNSGGIIWRVYGAEWEATVFRPAATVESKIRGKTVHSVARTKMEPNFLRYLESSP